MIRRWTFINSLNFNKIKTSSCWTKVKFEEASIDSLYIRHQSIWITKSKRTVLARRRHLHQLLQFHNILADWSNDYINLKNYNRFIYNDNFFKNTIITNNVALSLNLQGKSNINIIDFIKTTPHRKWLFYYNRRYKFSYTLWKILTSLNTTILSTPYSLKPETISHKYYVPIYRKLNTSVVSADSGLVNCQNVFTITNSLITSNNILIMLEIYKVSILLSIFKSFN